MTTENIKIYGSNRVEALYHQWKQHLFDGEGNPFKRRLIITSTPAMKDWLQQQLVQDPDFGISAGLEFGSEEQIISRLQGLLFLAPSTKAHTPSVAELTWMIELLLKQISKTNWHGKEQKLWQPVVEYLNTDDINLRKRHQRLLSFSAHLAHIFFQYGQYGCLMLQKWAVEETSEWQGALWHMLKQQYPNLAFPYQFLEEELTTKVIPENSISLHLFGISFFPRRLHSYFKRISTHIPVHYYLLSPCQMFWTDMCSDKEKRRTRHFWEKKGASEAQVDTLETYLSDRNKLLANLGRMGREMSELLEEYHAPIEDRYLLPQSTIQHEKYFSKFSDDILIATSNTELTLLEAVQADMALLCSSNDSGKIPFEVSDCSIQVHRATTKMREMEILYNELIARIHTNANCEQPIAPSDIIIMVPDINAYETSIAAVFGSKDSLLPYELVGSSGGRETLIQGYIHMLNLACSRWEMKNVLALLEIPEFQQKHKFSWNDILQIRMWTEKSGIQWGQTSSHREELLKRAHHQSSPPESAPMGTWEYGLQRLLMGIAIDASTPLQSLSFPYSLPSEGVEMSDIALFAKWMSIIDNLKQQLSSLHDGLYTLQEWATKLLQLKADHFEIDFKDNLALKSDKTLSDKLNAIAKASTLIPLETFAYDSVKQKLESHLNENELSYGGMNLHAVRFCTHLSQRAVPSRVIGFIGMSEGAYPRPDSTSSLNLISKIDGNDYCPSSVDYDRYLFLEALLSARSYFIVTYVGYSSEEQKDTPPSLLVRELFSYIDEGYTIAGDTPSKRCHVIHPFDPFHKSYFEIPDNTAKPMHFTMAEAFYGKSKTAPHTLIDNFMNSECHVEDVNSQVLTSIVGLNPTKPGDSITRAGDLITISISDLTAFATNPIKTYFNKKLGLYINKDELDSPTRDFALPAIEKYQLRVEAIKTPTEELWHKATRQGKLPCGMFKTIAATHMEKDVSDMHAILEKNNVTAESITKITFAEHYISKGFCPKKGWMLPPLYVSKAGQKAFKIVGTILDVTGEGALFHQDRDLKHLIKQWPKSLILLEAIKMHDLPIKPQLISTKNPKPIHLNFENSNSLLERFISYYLNGVDALSLLLPEWVPPLLKEQSIDNIIQEQLNDDFQPLYNEYARWLFRSPSPVMDNILKTPWQQLAEELYGDLHASLKAKTCPSPCPQKIRKNC